MQSPHFAFGSPSPDQGALENREDQIMALLGALGIEEIEFSLNGGGDSGDTTLEHVRYADGHDENRLPDIPIGFHPHGEAYTLERYLESLASDLPEGDWVNNEGGYGEVFLRPMADEDERFECNMTFRDEDEYEDEDDFDEDLDDADEADTVHPKLTGEDAKAEEDTR
ncbi:DUF6878 family protein [Aquibium sp. LZ166]|uniref:DUF6878 family protein n=1 Tax=Aquibium pacificus TaxID=3153579 RepID=A0ABV3ST57_9HYPH